MTPKDWPDCGERRKQNMDLMYEVRSLLEKVATLQSAVTEIKEVLLGDGKENVGMASQIRQNTKELKEHIDWDKWLFVFIGGGQIASVILLLVGKP